MNAVVNERSGVNNKSPDEELAELHKMYLNTMTQELQQAEELKKREVQSTKSEIERRFEEQERRLREEKEQQSTLFGVKLTAEQARIAESELKAAEAKELACLQMTEVKDKHLTEMELLRRQHHKHTQSNNEIVQTFVGGDLEIKKRLLSARSKPDDKAQPHPTR